MRYEEGEYMDLVWDGTPDAYYIKGHVSHEEGIAILIEEDKIQEDAKTWDGAPVGRAVQKYGRWSMEPREDGNGHVLKEYKTPGRGRFKITAFGVGIFAKEPK